MSTLAMVRGDNPRSAASAYDYAAKLGRRDWAWEFLRRNPVFRAEHSAAALRPKNRGRMAVLCAADKADIFGRWGCLPVAAPDERAPGAAVFWKPDICSDVLRTMAFERRAGIDAAVFDPAKVKCQLAVLTCSDFEQHLLFRDGDLSLQIAVTGSDVSNPVHLLPEPIKPDGEHHLRGLQRLHSLLSTGCLPAEESTAERHSSRLRVVLQSLDGYLAGMPYREIALTIFGERRVRADWDDPGRHLQDHIRRAVRRGRKLMSGGYLKILQSGTQLSE